MTDYGYCIICGKHRARDYGLEVRSLFTCGIRHYDYRLCGKCANKWRKEIDKVMDSLEREVRHERCL